MSSFDIDDVSTNTSPNLHFSEIVKAVRSRRDVLKAGLALGAVSFLSPALVACSDDDDDDGGGGGGGGGDGGATLGFAAVAASSGDAIVVPTGYKSAVFCRWGDKLFPNSPDWKGDASETAADQLLQFGDNHDGMHFFPLNDSSTEGLLVMNHEYTNNEYLYPAAVVNGTTPFTLDHVRKSQYAHGISVAHVRLENGSWSVVIPSSYNRRITADSQMTLTGPAAGHALLKTAADPTGTASLGTANNCGNGFTMWGTYLTCEENFNGYFGTLNTETDTRTEAMKRYGLSAEGFGYRWHELDPRFDYSINPNESNRMGWVVEIDPFDSTSVPKKRTALGRVKHENCAQTLAADGRVVVYMGDDQAGDYVYKFVSTGKYVEGDTANNRNLLDSGTLYVAKFEAGASAGDMMGTGSWLALVPETATTDGSTLGAKFGDQATILIYARLAGDAVGATKMDRPEWVTVHPGSGDVYITMTNNSGRTTADEANPRVKNIYGHIVRWTETDRDAAATTFEWDLFVLAGNPTVTQTDPLQNGSENITADNLFNSPDGLAFDADGRLWIQTDGRFDNTGDYAGMGNNQMLVADPGTGEIRRFLVGPSGCEITGITFTPDQKYVFINVQHPGEYGSHPRAPQVAPQDNPLAFSQWPESNGGRPRSATVVIWKEDGGKVGT